MTQLKNCKFCQIVSGANPSNVVLDEENILAFMDIRPLIIGHCLLIPKTHITTLNELPEKLVPDLFTGAQRLAKSLELGLKAEGTFVAINNRISQSVPHLHIHVVPRYTKDGLKGFFWPRHKYNSEDQVKETQLKIINALEQID